MGFRADMPPSPLPITAPLNVPQALAQALNLHKKGRVADAERLYASILTARPDHVDALQYLALIRYDQGRFPEALQLTANAMRVRTPSPRS
jgi:tetratricopeptide (TPR) repeat protein